MRLVLVLSMFAACVGVASPARAQDSTRAPVLALRPSVRPEPPVAPGTVRVRFANGDSCPMAIRVSKDGQVVGIAVVPAGSLEWGHFAAGGSIIEVEILVTPRLCQAELKPPPSDTLRGRASPTAGQ